MQEKEQGREQCLTFEIPDAKIYADTLAEIRHRPPVGKQPIRDI